MTSKCDLENSISTQHERLLFSFAFSCCDMHHNHKQCKEERVYFILENSHSSREEKTGARIRNHRGPLLLTCSQAHFQPSFLYGLGLACPGMVLPVLLRALLYQLAIKEILSCTHQQTRWRPFLNLGSLFPDTMSRFRIIDE